MPLGTMQHTFISPSQRLVPLLQGLRFQRSQQQVHNATAVPLVFLELCRAVQNKVPLQTDRGTICTLHAVPGSGAGGRIHVGHLRGEEAADRVDIEPLWEGALGRAVRGGLPDVERRPGCARAAQLHAPARLLRLQPQPNQHECNPHLESLAQLTDSPLPLREVSCQGCQTWQLSHKRSCEDQM